MNPRLFAALARPTPGVARYLTAPETFEGVVQRVDVVERTRDFEQHYFVSFILDPVNVALSTARLALLAVHDEVQYAPLPNESAVDFLARVRQLQTTDANRIEREKPVRVTYTFRTNFAVQWKTSAADITAIYRMAHGDAFADELAARLQGSFNGDGVSDGAHPFIFDKDIDGEYTAPTMRMLQELRGLRFIVNATARKTQAGMSFTRYEWVRSRD